MAQPSLQDFLTNLDPTAFTEISGAQLLQLTTGASPYNDKGMLVFSTDVAGIPTVPNAFTITKWSRYMWVRVSSTFVTAYLWNPNGNTDATYLNWVTLNSASIGPGTIQGYQIAASTITSANIQSVSSALITGSVVPGWLAALNDAQTAYVTNGIIQTNSPLFGDLGGAGSTLAVPVIADDAVNSAKLLSNDSGPSTSALLAAVDPANNITVPSKSVVGVISTSNDVPTQNVAAGDVLAVNVLPGGGVSGYCTNSKAILKVAEPGVQTYNQSVVVAATGTTYGVVNSNGSSFGRILQMVEVYDKAAASINAQCALTSAPTTSNTTHIAALDCTITPVAGTSTLMIEVLVNLSSSTTSFNAVVALMRDGTANAIAAVVGTRVPAAGSVGTTSLRFSVVGATVGVATTFKVYLACSGANLIYYNSTDGATVLFGGTLGANSHIRVTEYI